MAAGLNCQIRDVRCLTGPSIAPVTVCDPLSDDNIFYLARERPVGRAEAEKSILVVAARLDALALFDQVEVGFDSPATGIVTLLTVAKVTFLTLVEFH